MLQEIRHLKAARAARDQELAEAQRQLEAERTQTEELERNLLSQVQYQLYHLPEPSFDRITCQSQASEQRYVAMIVNSVKHAPARRLPYSLQP